MGCELSFDPAAPVPAPAGETRARPEVATVRRVDFRGVSLIPASGEPFDAGVRGRLMGSRKSLGNAVVVGDRVRVAWEGDQARIDSVEPRRSFFSRRAAGEREEEQVVAANLDQVVIVASLRRPEFRHGFVDRVLVQALHSRVPALLALNKTDLGDEAETAGLLGDYAPAGVAGIPLCARSGRGVEALRDACRGRRSLFVGHSGVGKSTLLDRLAPGHELLAAEVNERTGKGRHTTTAALLLQPAPGLELIDTPGVRAFALWGVDAATLEEYYPEIHAHRGGCRFDDCRHDREPGCAVRAAVERGEIHERRFASFHKLRDELEGGRR